MKTGVYLIVNTVNWKVYVGSTTKGFMKRWWDHLTEFRKGRHAKHFQSAYNKYGEKSFRFLVLEECPPERCLEREQYWMDCYRSYRREIGYNTSPTAGNCRGTKHSEEFRKRVGDRSRGISASLETRRRMSSARTGHYGWTGKKVDQYTRDWRFVRTWDNACIAGRTFRPDNHEVAGGNIRRCCRGKKPNAYKFLWLEHGKLPPSSSGH